MAFANDTQTFRRGQCNAHLVHTTKPDLRPHTDARQQTCVCANDCVYSTFVCMPKIQCHHPIYNHVRHTGLLSIVACTRECHAFKQTLAATHIYTVYTHTKRIRTRTPTHAVWRGKKEATHAHAHRTHINKNRGRVSIRTCRHLEMTSCAHVIPHTQKYMHIGRIALRHCRWLTRT